MHHIRALNHLFASLTIDSFLIFLSLTIIFMYESTITWFFFLVLSSFFFRFQKIHYVHFLKIIAYPTSWRCIASCSLRYSIKSFFYVIFIACYNWVRFLMVVVIFSIGSLSLSPHILDILMNIIRAASINTSISLNSSSFFFCDYTRLGTSTNIGIKSRLTTIWITLYTLLKSHISSIDLPLLHFSIDFWKTNWIFYCRWWMVWRAILLVHINIHWHSLHLLNVLC